MIPVLFNIGSFPVSSFGLILALGIFIGSFAVWRVARAYEYDAEKILDLIFLTIGIGFVLSRAVFVVNNLEVFDSVSKIFFVNRYPGLSFWGGFIGGLIALTWLSKRNKLPFLLAGDLALIGFFIGAFFAEIGCLLGSCGSGVETNLVIGVEQIGLIGKRLPIQVFEALAFLIGFFIFWKTILKFHIQGSIFAKGLMLLGIIKFSAEFYKALPQSIRILNYEVNIGLIIPALIFLIGIKFYYRVYKKTPGDDLTSVYQVLTSRTKQKLLVTKFIKGCYNQKVNFGIRVGRLRKRLFKFFNIRSNPESF